MQAVLARPLIIAALSLAVVSAAIAGGVRYVEARESAEIAAGSTKWDGPSCRDRRNGRNGT